jgi:hypothetical protein
MIRPFLHRDDYSCAIRDLHPSRPNYDSSRLAVEFQREFDVGYLGKTKQSADRRRVSSGMRD